MVQISRKEFELLVERSLRRLPKRFRERLQNIAVVVEDWADDETLEDMGIEPPTLSTACIAGRTSPAGTPTTGTCCRT